MAHRKKCTFAEQNLQFNQGGLYSLGIMVSAVYAATNATTPSDVIPGETF